MPVSIVNSGDASSASVEELSASFGTLAAYIQKGLDDHGYQIVIGRLLSSTHPDLKDYDVASAVHESTTKHIYFGEYYKTKAIGDEAPEELLSKEFASALAHEAGHFVDLYLAGTGEYPDGCSCMREVFKAAFREDAKRLAHDDYRQVREAAENFGCSEDYVEAELDHFKALFIDAIDPEYEVYAEIFANMQGQFASMSFPITPFLPQCAALVQADENRLNPTPVPQP
jgi:hypothetical protein